jgi:hypothetical protein
MKTKKIYLSFFIIVLFLNFYGQTPATLSSSVLAKDGSLRIQPFPNSNVKKFISKGESVSIITGLSGGYYFVEYRGEKGYLSEVFFKNEDPSSLTKTNFSDGSPTSVTSQIKNAVEVKINAWQQKGEFEKSIDYQARVNEQTRKLKIQEFTNAEINILKEENKKFINKNTFRLGEYDADNEAFLIKTDEFGEFAIKVPISFGPLFKEKWDKMEFHNIDFSLKKDKFYISKVDVYYPDKKQTFNFDSKNAATYSNINIAYNFSPIEINLTDQDKNDRTAINSKNYIIGRSDIDSDIPLSLSQNSNYFAVIIGNEDYKNEIKVNYAINDAKSIYEYFSKTLGIPSNNIRRVENATYGQMLSEIEWLNNISKAFNGKVKLYFYYAGHGIPSEQTKSSYLLPVDGNSAINQTALKTEELYSKLIQHSPQLVTIFLDACFSGAARDGMLVDGRGVTIKPKKDALVGNIVVFSASSDDETAFPYREKQHGLFTYFLLEKIRESKGDVTYVDLSEYIKTNVNQQSIIINQKNQTPQTNTSLELNENWRTYKIK